MHVKMVLTVVSRRVEANAARLIAAELIFEELKANSFHMSQKLLVIRTVLIAAAELEVHKVTYMSLRNALVVCCAPVLPTIGEDHTEVIPIHHSIIQFFTMIWRSSNIALNKLAKGAAIAKRGHFRHSIVLVEELGGFAPPVPPPKSVMLH